MGLEFGDLVLAGDAKVDVALCDKAGDVGGGEEDKGEGVVFDKGNVKAIVAVELDVYTKHRQKRGFIELGVQGDSEGCGFVEG